MKKTNSNLCAKCQLHSIVTNIKLHTDLNFHLGLKLCYLSRCFKNTSEQCIVTCTSYLKSGCDAKFEIKAELSKF